MYQEHPVNYAYRHVATGQERFPDPHSCSEGVRLPSHVSCLGVR